MFKKLVYFDLFTNLNDSKPISPPTIVYRTVEYIINSGPAPPSIFWNGSSKTLDILSKNKDTSTSICGYRLCGYRKTGPPPESKNPRHPPIIVYITFLRFI